MLTFILLLVVLIVLFPTVPAPLRTIIGIAVGVIVLVWLLSLLGVGGINTAFPHLN